MPHQGPPPSPTPRRWPHPPRRRPHRRPARRLHLVVNHARFLAFPDRERLPYLASRDFYREHGKPRQLFPRPPRHPPRPCTCGRTRTACAARPATPPSAARRSPATCAGGWRSSAGGCRSRSPRPSPAWPWTARPRAAAGGATALYTDGLSLFGHKSTAEGRDPKSEFQRALTALGVSHLVAPNPQAKGRIERRFSPCRPAS